MSGVGQEGIRSVTVPVGGVWEGESWEVQFDVPHSTYRSVHKREDGTEVEYSAAETPCPHAVGYRQGDSQSYPETTYSNGTRYFSTETQFHWTVPRVVVMTNEAGYASTGVCLDCIVAWARGQDQGGQEP